MKALQPWQRIAVVVGSALLIVGSYLTWVSVDLGFASFASNGVDTTEGKLTLATGVALLLVAVAVSARGAMKRIASWFGVAAAGFGGIVLLLEYLDVRQRIAEADPNTAMATIGAGIWVTAVGAALALVATGSLASRTLRDTE